MCPLQCSAEWCRHLPRLLTWSSLHRFVSLVHITNAHFWAGQLVYNKSHGASPKWKTTIRSKIWGRKQSRLKIENECAKKRDFCFLFFGDILLKAGRFLVPQVLRRKPCQWTMLPQPQARYIFIMSATKYSVLLLPVSFAVELHYKYLAPNVISLAPTGLIVARLQPKFKISFHTQHYRTNIMISMVILGSLLPAAYPNSRTDWSYTWTSHHGTRCPISYTAFVSTTDTIWSSLQLKISAFLVGKQCLLVFCLFHSHLHSCPFAGEQQKCFESRGCHGTCLMLRCSRSYRYKGRESHFSDNNS